MYKSVRAIQNAVNDRVLSGKNPECFLCARHIFERGFRDLQCAEPYEIVRVRIVLKIGFPTSERPVALRSVIQFLTGSGISAGS